MKIIFSFFALVFMAGNYCHAQTVELKPIYMVGKNDCEAVLQEIVPDEYQCYKDLSAKGYDLKTAQAALSLVDKTRAVYSEHRDDKDMPEEKHFHMDISQMFAWEIVIQTFKKTTDESAKAEMLSAWNTSLKDELDTVAMISALKDEWEPAFLTDQFLKLFKKTRSIELITKFCRVLGQYGEYAEEKILNEKTDFVMNNLVSGTAEYDVALSNIESALKKIGYWKEGDTQRIGPCCISAD